MFKRAVVLDIVMHPGLLSDSVIKKLTESNSNFKLANQKNPEFLKSLPVNSIIGSFVDNKNIFVAFPFFSSHMCLPLKRQEEVWIYEDTSAARDFENEYYWISRVHGTNLYEDVNYTHADRKYLKDYKQEKVRNSLNIENLEKVSVALFNNGPIRGNNTGTSGDTGITNRDKKIKESLNLSSSHLLEDVPRTFKNPGDYIIQGSNNTLIRLGTNHIRESSDNYNEIYYNTIFAADPDAYSGTIDIVAGRAALSQSLAVEKKYVNYFKNEEKLFFKNITTGAYKNSQLIIYNENEIAENLKDSEFYLGNRIINWAEGDPDFFTDISRILVSEYINGDKLLNSGEVNSISMEGIKNSLDNKERGYIIAKSDEIRLIARGTVISKNHSKSDQLEKSNLIENDAGSIRIIKEGGEDKGYVIIDSTGHISIDGPTIVLGDKKRIKENGTGDSIYLGNDSHEPGVLGYMLKNKLENFMDETIRALNIIGLCLKDLDGHVHQYAGPAGLTLFPIPGTASGQLPTFAVDNGNFQTWPDLTNTNARERSGSPDDKTGNYGKVNGMGASDSKKLEDKINDIVKIRDSLNDILSKFVKTL